MCGIVGIIGKNDLIPNILKSLKALEYRGYDSAGIAFKNDQKIKEIKTVGKISNLLKKYKKHIIESSIIIGHTRWATHGKPIQKNAHPFLKSQCALVHNGIIENYKDLIKKYKINKKNLLSDTDSEVIAEIINILINENNNPINIIQRITKDIKGTYAFVILFKNDDSIYAVKKGSPLIIGTGKNHMSISSDILGLPINSEKVIYLEDNDIIKLNLKHYKIINNNRKKKIDIHPYISYSVNIHKGKYKHYMLKEICEQPIAIKDTLINYTNISNKKVNFPNTNLNFNNILNIHLTACGTAYHACMIAKYWFEEFTNIQTSIDISSEYRYRKCTLKNDSLGIVVSQSGETMDSLESLKKYLIKNIQTVSIVNVITSSIGRKSKFILPTIAGREIGVASTKAFTTQLLVLALFAIHIGNQRRIKTKYNYIKSIFLLPKKIEETLKCEISIKKLIPTLYRAKSIFYIGRGTMYPLALEGALKLKEITYKHCEGYAGGELKHGPIALIEKNIPVIALAPYNEHFDKLISNIEEIKARDGEIIILTDEKGSKKINKKIKNVIIIPNSNFVSAPILYSIPLQLIAYHLADYLGTDIDQPRNLAKSVTVE